MRLPKFVHLGGLLLDRVGSLSIRREYLLSGWELQLFIRIVLRSLQPGVHLAVALGVEQVRRLTT